jgi:hypothetical protein
MVLVARDAKHLEVPTNRSASLVPRDDMIGLALFPVQLVLFQAFGVCASSFLLAQDLTAIPWGDASGVFVDHSTEFADTCSVDVWDIYSYFAFNPFLEAIPISGKLTV